MKFCNVDVVEVKVLENYRLFLQFDDGTSGEIDISEIIPFNGVFKALEDQEYFSHVALNKDIGTICWENGADLSPAFLRQKVINTQINPNI